MPGKLPVGLPTPPTPPNTKGLMPRPYTKGDKILHGHDIVASTNEGPWPHKGEMKHYERGITREEDRRRWSSGKEVVRRGNAEAADPNSPQRRALRTPASSRKVSR